ncbi:Pept_C1 domain-containing protein [Meloidogyne graminicola]|uniref:Pept_C1 domain-containing protein n=1 Tax=Meloidogyne graminicola TaxID=189291 RepID=A0A8S9Z7N2_9BILA|nr:Pept_C1 domain-containing protein [Meloidogyne graminicola]
MCGSCWAVSTASAFGDRWCIKKVGQSTQFSALDLFSCSTSSDGCKGGDPYGAWKFIKSKGVCTGSDYKTKNGCKPYPYPSSGSTPRKQCSSSCSNSNWKITYSKDKHFATTVKALQGSSATVQAIQKEIQTNGPVVAGFMVYQDFMTYKSGVYYKTANARQVGGHAVVIMGWGTQTCNGKKLDFWLIKNSWGTGFGEKGYFKMRRGVNECGIEKDEISFGIPKI